jgi:hypothetical protein
MCWRKALDRLTTCPHSFLAVANLTRPLREQPTHGYSGELSAVAASSRSRQYCELA